LFSLFRVYGTCAMTLRPGAGLYTPFSRSVYWSSVSDGAPDFKLEAHAPVHGGRVVRGEERVAAPADGARPRGRAGEERGDGGRAEEDLSEGVHLRLQVSVARGCRLAVAACGSELTAITDPSGQADSTPGTVPEGVRVLST
jgi:hypothetical protein